MQIASKESVQIFSQIDIKDVPQLPDNPELGWLCRYKQDLYLWEKNLNGDPCWKMITGPHKIMRVLTRDDLDKIEEDVRYEGLQVYVEDEGISYYLSGGIENQNWTTMGFISKIDISRFKTKRLLKHLIINDTILEDPIIKLPRSCKRISGYITVNGNVSSIGGSVFLALLKENGSYLSNADATYKWIYQNGTAAFGYSSGASSTTPGYLLYRLQTSGKFYCHFECYLAEGQPKFGFSECNTEQNVAYGETKWSWYEKYTDRVDSVKFLNLANFILNGKGVGELYLYSDEEEQITPTDTYSYESIYRLNRENYILDENIILSDTDYIDKFKTSLIVNPNGNTNENQITLVLNGDDKDSGLVNEYITLYKDNSFAKLDITAEKINNIVYVTVNSLKPSDNDILDNDSLSINKTVFTRKLKDNVYLKKIKIFSNQNADITLDVLIQSNTHLISQNPDLITGLAFRVKEDDQTKLYINPGAIELNGRVWNVTKEFYISCLDENNTKTNKDWYYKEEMDVVFDINKDIYVYCDTSRRGPEFVFCSEKPTRDRYFNLLNDTNNRNTLAKYHPYNAFMRYVGRVQFDEDYNIKISEDLYGNITENTIKVNIEYEYADTEKAGIIKLASDDDFDQDSENTAVTPKSFKEQLYNAVKFNGIQDWEPIEIAEPTQIIRLNNLPSENANDYVISLNGLLLLPNKQYTIDKNNDRIVLSEKAPSNTILSIRCIGGSTIIDTKDEIDMVASRLYLFFEGPGSLE